MRNNEILSELQENDFNLNALDSVQETTSQLIKNY